MRIVKGLENRPYSGRPKVLNVFRLTKSKFRVASIIVCRYLHREQVFDNGLFKLTDKALGICGMSDGISMLHGTCLRVIKVLCPKKGRMVQWVGHWLRT